MRSPRLDSRRRTGEGACPPLDHAGRRVVNRGDFAAVADEIADGEDDYLRLLRPEGHFWVAGDQVSEISGWQEDAIRSSLYVLEHMAHPELLSALPVRTTAQPQLKARAKENQAADERTAVAQCGAAALGRAGSTDRRRGRRCYMERRLHAREA
jgi:hypothetical protein